MFLSDDHDGKWTWLICVGWATAVQVLLIILCFIVRNVQSMAVYLVYLYLPGLIVAAGGEAPGMSALAVRILFFLSVAFYSVLFGSLVYFGHRYIRFLRSNGEDRPQKPVSESEPETREGQGETSSNCESDGGAKWGCCVSVLVVLQPLLILCGFDDGIVGSLYKQYVVKPAEWLLPVSSQHYTGINLFPVELFLLLVVGTFYSVLFGTLFYWLCRGASCLFKLVPRKAAGK
jgi:hypothetical protein